MNSMTLVLFMAVVIATASAQFETKPIVPIVQFDETRDESGQFSLRYVSGDGTTVSEHGKFKPGGPEGTDYIFVKEGSYSFTTPEGKNILLEYIADENGFQPKGDHLPVAPIA